MRGLGRFIVRHRWPVIAGYLIVVVGAGLLGRQALAGLQYEGYDDPGSDSAAVADVLAEEFGLTPPVLVLTIATPADPDTPLARNLALAYLDEVAEQSGVARLVSYWDTGSPLLRSPDGRTTQVLVYAEPAADLIALASAVRDLRPVPDSTRAAADGLTVWVGGAAALGSALTTAISDDLTRAELVAIPITAIVLILVFGSLIAAGLPFLVAALAILGSLAVLTALTMVTDVSVFALNLITGLGLALGIDYALLMINRFREELRVAPDGAVDTAVITTVATAGTTVVVSGITVAATLASLMLFPQYFFASFAYAGIATSLLAVLGAITALPALLSLLGPRVNLLRVRRGDLAPQDTGGWARVARFVMRRPWPVLLVTSAALLAVAAPALGAQFSQIDDRALPRGNPAAIASEAHRERFTGYDGVPVEVLLRTIPPPAVLTDYATALSRLPGVVRVTTPVQVIADGMAIGRNPEPVGWQQGQWTRVSIVSDVRPRDAAGIDLIERIRAVPVPGEILLGGVAADYADATAAIYRTLPWVALWIAVVTMVILFLYTGSVLIPVKAVVLAALSLVATLGALVWVFQGGHLQWLVGDHLTTGTLDLSTVALIAVVAFALSMDYEIFLLARIKEEHDRGADTTTAVAIGLQRTGRIVTAAALLIAIVFASFMSGGVSSVKQLGFGVTFAILVDATIVRGLLVPAFMRIAGGANWWAPGWLRGVHARVGLRD